MKAYVVLSGQTDLDIQGIIIGKNDPPLNETGLEQARSVVSSLSGKGISMILSSPQIRTMATAEIIAEGIGLEDAKIMKGMKLHERDFGDLEGTPTSEVDMFAQNSWFHNAETPNGETVKETANRVIAYMNNMVKIFRTKTMLLVVPEHLLGVMFWFFNGLPQLGKESAVDADNCAVFEFDTDNIPQEIKEYQPVSGSSDSSGGGGDDPGRLLSQSEIDELIAEITGA
ncbi:MAG: histidine phosphatase family protein [Oscillospiraceae bacterium]|nr:histidine phosphatase family protein [Oscillospiraceae bacterium]MCL2279794.1 histidine phosphatase family protein [Oscillospiraceae bacterium]